MSQPLGHEAREAPVDPSAVFGRKEALWTYHMAGSLSTSSLDDRTVAERAEDAVRTAMRQSERYDIDVVQATRSLLERLDEETLGEVVDDKKEE